MDKSIRQVLVASAVGSALEWYDFFIYGTAAALVFGELFFPKADPAVGTLLAFASFGVGFIARPFGGLLFGHLGDRIGRKPVLVITLMLVGVGTFLIGLLPTYDSIGFWAPILLVVLRLVQGFGAGAEYGGAVIMAVEHAPPGKRGLYGSFAPLGVTFGILLANGVFALFTMLPREEFLAWGWRVPFLLSMVLILVGFYIRSRVSETPVFTEIAAKNKAARSPVIEAVRRHPREFLVVVGARMGENGLGYPSDAGTVLSFDGTTLVISLSKGGTVRGAVTQDTTIWCQTADEYASDGSGDSSEFGDVSDSGDVSDGSYVGDYRAARSSDDPTDDSGGNDGTDPSTDDPGTDDGTDDPFAADGSDPGAQDDPVDDGENDPWADDPSNECAPSDLAAGTVVHEADVSVTAQGAEFDEIDLVK